MIVMAMRFDGYVDGDGLDDDYCIQVNTLAED